MNEQVSRFIAAAPEEHKSIMEAIRQLIHASVKGVEEDVKWGRPVFKKEKDFAYLTTTKNYVTLGFFERQKLHDPDGLLEGTGKQMCHIKIKKANTIDKKVLQSWIKASAK